MNLDKKEIAQKKVQLEKIRAELKKEFFGIDKCIDDVIESIKTWYLIPSILSRPVIVNLFGMTGNGKTSLVRSLVQKLNFNGRFIEVQMDGFSNGGKYHYYESTICQMLEASSITEGEPGIILLDEFQRFRTVDKDNNDIKLERYADVWMLLSDGKFPNDYSILTKIEEEVASLAYKEDWRQYEANKPKKEEEIKKEKENEDNKRKFTLYPYEAIRVKQMLHLSETVMEIMTWDSKRVISEIQGYRKQHKGFLDYTKCLIFVAGNLDEAFEMSGHIEDCDTNADIFYEYTKKIGVPEIKNALFKRFRPEQIARLGNNHIIYPSLNADAYRKIIKRTCKEYIYKAQKVCKLKFKISNAMYQEIYDNSVYPTQGTRPVFTSIHKMFGSPLADAILWGMENNATNITIDLNGAASEIIFTDNKNRKLTVHVDLELRTRRAKRSKDFNTLIAVHEAGHAVAHAILFNNPPLEIAINVTSFEGGYNIFKDKIATSKEDILNSMAVSLAGSVAEAMIFGDNYKTSGCASDLSHATKIAARYVRRLGFGKLTSYVLKDQDCNLNHGMDETNKMIDEILQKQKIIAEKILEENRELVIELSKYLLEHKKLDSRQSYNFIKKYIPDLQQIGDRDVRTGYYNLLVAAS